MRREHIERLLPAGFQRSMPPGSVLSALLDVMELLHAPSESTLEHVDDLIAGYRAPDQLLPYLTRWVALDHLLGTPSASDTTGGVPPGRLRDLVANAGELAATRGTSDGLCRLLTIVCGVDGFHVDEPADRPFHIVVRVPAGAANNLDLIRRVVAAEKPAATTCEVVMAAVPETTSTTPTEQE
jgi:phage tail-like protein